MSDGPLLRVWSLHRHRGRALVILFQILLLLSSGPSLLRCGLSPLLTLPLCLSFQHLPPVQYGSGLCEESCLLSRSTQVFSVRVLTKISFLVLGSTESLGLISLRGGSRVDVGARGCSKIPLCRAVSPVSFPLPSSSFQSSFPG